MKIRSKILLAILVTLSPLLLFSLAITRNNLNLSQRLTDLEQVTARMERVNHLQVSVTDLPSAPNDFLSTGAAAERERFDRAISQVQTDILALSMIHQTGEETSLLAETSSQVDAIIALGNEIFTLSQPVGNPEGIALMRQMDTLASDLASGSLAQPHSLIVAEMVAANTIFKQEMARTNRWLLFGVPAILLFSLAMGLLFARNLTAPLRELQAGAEQIAGGQFDSRLNIRTGDELEALAANFNRMAGRLSELYAGLEQQVAERTAELAVSEARYRGLAQTAVDAIITIDTDGRIRFFNRAAERIFGYPADEALNQDVGILIPPEYVEAHQTGIQRYLETGEPHIIGHTVEFKGQRQDGEIFPLEMSLSEVRTETDLSFTGIIRDITRRNLAEAEIHRRNRDLTLLNRVISTASATLEPIEILETICRELVTAFNVTHAAAALPDEKGESLRIVAEARQEGQPRVLGITIPISGSPPMQSLWAKQETVVMDDSSPFLREVWGEKWWAVATGSLLVSPLLAGDQALGAVALVNEKKRPFSADEITLVEHVAAAAAHVLANARLLDGERRRRTELETLHHAGLALAGSLDTTAVLEAVLSHTLNLVGAMDAYIFFYRNRQLTFAAKKWADGYQEPPTPLTFKPGGLTETVAVTGQRVVIPDIPGDPEYARRLWGGAYVGLPLRTGEQVLGVMNIAFEQPRAFIEDELRLLELLAAQAAAALENARLFAEVNDALNREKQLTEIARTINSALELPVVLETIVRQAVELVGAGAGAMALKDPGGETISYPYIFNLPASLSLQLARQGRGLAWRVVETGDSFLFADYRSQPDAQPQWVAAGIQAIMAVPVAVGEKRIGALGLFGLTPEKQFSQRDLLLAETVGRQAGIAIQNARLFEAEQAYAAELETRVADRTADLIALNAELARAARAKDEFLAHMSHELRTPLSSILLRSELLQRQVYGDLTDRQVNSLQIIDAAGQHLLSLINDILDVAKIEAGKVELDIQFVSVKAVCQASLQMVKEMAHKKSIELCNQIGPTAVSLQADNRRLKQILVNLLSNAVKFTPEGGRVGLEVTGDAEQEIIWFTVWDTGIGIAARGMERLFQPFEQLDSGLSRQFEGTGLGLTLVRRLAELHLGSVSVTSEAGAGSRFTVALSWKSGADWEGGAEIESGKTAVSRAAPVVDDLVETILLADDNEILVIGMEDFLIQAGYRVEVAHNGAEAVAYASEEAPDLILMDTHMPVLDGLEAIRRIRATEDLADVPIVSLTALAMPGDRERCLEAGATAYLSKPIRLDELKELIERLLRIEN